MLQHVGGRDLALSADPAFLATANGRVYVYSRAAGVLEDNEGRRIRVAPFASDLEIAGNTAYLAYPREARIRTINLTSMKIGEVAVGAVPVDIAFAGGGTAITARILAVADPSAKRVWLTESTQSTAEAVARGFLRGFIGLGLFGSRSSRVSDRSRPRGDARTDVDRVRLQQRHALPLHAPAEHGRREECGAARLRADGNRRGVVERYVGCRKPVCDDRPKTLRPMPARDRRDCARSVRICNWNQSQVRHPPEVAAQPSPRRRRVQAAGASSDCAPMILIASGVVLMLIGSFCVGMVINRDGAPNTAPETVEEQPPSTTGKSHAEARRHAARARTGQGGIDSADHQRAGVTGRRRARRRVRAHRRDRSLLRRVRADGASARRPRRSAHRRRSSIRARITGAAYAQGRRRATAARRSTARHGARAVRRRNAVRSARRKRRP